MKLVVTYVHRNDSSDGRVHAAKALRAILGIGLAEAVDVLNQTKLTGQRWEFQVDENIYAEAMAEEVSWYYGQHDPGIRIPRADVIYKHTNWMVRTEDSPLNNPLAAFTTDQLLDELALRDLQFIRSKQQG